MSATSTPEVAAFLDHLDGLSFSERLREAAVLARAQANDRALPARLDALLQGGAHEGLLAVVMAQAVRDRGHLVAAIHHRSLIVRRTAIDALLRIEPGPDDERQLTALVHALPSALRQMLLRRLLCAGRPAVARALFPEVLERHGPREAAMLLPVLEDSTLRAHLPALAHVCFKWRRLYIQHPAVVLEYLTAKLAAAAPRERPAIWQQHAALLAALAELAGAVLLDLLAAFPDTCPPHLLWTRLGDLARSEPAGLTALLERPPLRGLLQRAGFPRALLNQIRRFSPELRVRLGRLVAEQPERLAALLGVVAPGQREALLTAATAGHESTRRLWPEVLLARLPRALQRREAARMLALSQVRADPERVQALSAYLELAAAEPALRPALRAADAEQRAPAVARLIACAGREGTMTATLTALLPRLKNEQDPVRLQAFTALAAVPPGVFVPADAEPLRALVTAATEARDTSHTTRQQIQALAFRLLRTHADHARAAQFQVGLDLLDRLAGQTATLVLPDLSRGLPRRTAPEIVAALAPRLAAASARDRPEMVLRLATALGRRAHGLTALTAMLEPLQFTKPDAIASRAIHLLLADPKTRDERVRALLAWDRSVVVLHPVLMHLHLRRQAWLDPFLDGTPIKGRFRDGRTTLVLGLQSGFHRWLPRQQRAFAALLARAADDRGHASLTRAAVIARLARLPITGITDFAPFLRSSEVPVIEAALGALAWIDTPADAMPVLLEHLDGDRARVAMYALPRVARFVDGAALATALLDLIAGPGRKVTVRKEALRLLGAHRSAASVPALQAALARPDLHKDVAIAVGHAARSLLDDPRALEILAQLAASPEPDIARSLLGPRPDLLPAQARASYAALVLGLTRHADLATRKAAIAALPAWSSGQEQTIAGPLAAALVDLESDTWSEARVALVEVAGEGPAVVTLVEAARGLAARLAEPGADPQARDLPALQRLQALCALLCGAPIERRLARQAAHEAVAAALVDDLLWPLAASLRIAALDLREPATAAAALHALVADARADLFLEPLATCLEEQVDAASALVEAATLVDLAAALAGGPPPAARLAVIIVTAAGTRVGWPEPACDLLRALRRHADLRVRHAAHQVFTRDEAPASA